jgi:hypothetical protein
MKKKRPRIGTADHPMEIENEMNEVVVKKAVRDIRLWDEGSLRPYRIKRTPRGGLQMTAD